MSKAITVSGQSTKKTTIALKAGYRRYTPILKSKLGELWALDNVSDSQAAWLKPLVEFHREKQGTVLTHVEKTTKALKKAWGTRQVFVDTHLFGISGAGATHCSTIFQNAVTEGLNFTPVTSLDRSAAYNAVVAAHSTNGVLVRLKPDDFADSNQLTTDLNALVGQLGIEKTSIDILIDYGAVSSQATLIQLIRAHVASLPYVNLWRTLITAGGSFPASLATHTPHTWHQLVRHEWAAWLGAIGGSPKLVRKPSFGDYGVRDTQPPADFGSPSANIRYTANGHFMLRRHDVLVKNGGSVGIHAICASLKTRVEYRGQTFTAGDSQIYITASQSQPTGNAGNWTAWGMSHHFGAVVDEIQTLPVS